VIGYEEAITILKDTRFKNRIPLPQTSKKYEQLKNIQNDHKRLRFLVSNVFTPRMVEHLRPYIQETVNDLLQQVQSKKSMD
jgi:pimeloyl-[acyl-carrier protein] synthase